MNNPGDDAVGISSTESYLAEHVRVFNAAVDNGNWNDFAERFADDAVLEFVGPPVGPFVGRAAIYDAYRQSAPDDRIDLNGPATIEADELVVPYRWHTTGATGSMRFARRGDRITRLVITFD
jgi:steroid delta-isomerase